MDSTVRVTKPLALGRETAVIFTIAEFAIPVCTDGPASRIGVATQNMSTDHTHIINSKSDIDSNSSSINHNTVNH